MYDLEHLESSQISFFKDLNSNFENTIEKRKKLSNTMDTINSKFGRDSVTIGSFPKNISQFSGTKVAFTRIPEIKEFYEYTKVDFYIFGTKLNKWKSVKISHYTHPNMTLIDAVYISSSLPLIFKPMYCDDDYIIDGGLSKRYTVKTAYEDGCKLDEIFGINIKRKEATNITILYGYAS